MKLINNKLVKHFYKVLFYFELGKNSIARFYQFIPDAIIIIGGLKYLVGINISGAMVIPLIIGTAILFTIMGFTIKKTGLYDIDRYVQADKDPVMKEILDAARRKK